jgi:hypothetical protein
MGLDYKMTADLLSSDTYLGLITFTNLWGFYYG